VVLVVPPAGDAPPVPADGVDAVVPGGATRSASVRAGLASVPDDAEVVVVHDAARPLAGADLFDATVAAVRAGADGAIAAAPVTDTVKRVEGERVVETLDRTALVAVQTPQAFAARVLRAAHAGEPEATDDAALVEAAGGRVVVVPGDRWNIKITEPADLTVASALLGGRA
jgi:2-C-methyl-D-erythritol 4-phosphate cytidylyltransferase